MQCHPSEDCRDIRLDGLQRIDVCGREWQVYRYPFQRYRRLLLRDIVLVCRRGSRNRRVCMRANANAFGMWQRDNHVCM